MDTSGYTDGNSSIAQFNQTNGIEIDAAGNLYVSENAFTGRIRKVTPNGTVSTFAGNENRGHVDGVLSNSKFSFPQDFAIN